MATETKVVCIGAGPAGLTAAQVLLESGLSTVVLEANPTYVGGISRTVKKDGFLIDIGGHRFFSKSKKITDFWLKTLGEDFLLRPRSSKIYYKKKFYQYPLKPMEAFLQLGLRESIRCLFSLLYWWLFPLTKPSSFAEWTQNQFGRRFFQIFFETYTEKVWGMKCEEISADWAAQRIRGVSPLSALFSSIWKKKESKKIVKSLIHSFYYPRFGPGMMWEKVESKILDLHGEVRKDAKVIGIDFHAEKRKFTVHYASSQNSVSKEDCEHLISSMPLQNLLECLPVTEEIRNLGGQLKYRDFIVVALITNEMELFEENWIYIHDPSVLVGRIQNFRAASPQMVPSSNFYCYGMEYFCNEGNDLWEKSDSDLVALAKQEMEKLGFAKSHQIEKGFVVRQKKAYPVYDHHYQSKVKTISEYLDKNFPNLHLVGRNGMHKYNNQDHSMMTAILTAQNIVKGAKIYNVWNVNQDAEYLELDIESLGELETGIRAVPTPLSANT